jgi:hypothetical protein
MTNKKSKAQAGRSGGGVGIPRPRKLGVGMTNKKAKRIPRRDRNDKRKDHQEEANCVAVEGRMNFGFDGEQAENHFGFPERRFRRLQCRAEELWGNRAGSF